MDCITIFGIIANCVTILGVSGLTVFTFLSNNFKKNHYIRKYRNVKTENGYILAVYREGSTMEGKIKAQFSGSLSHLKDLRIVPAKLPKKCNASTSRVIIDIIATILEEMSNEQKADIHLFFDGPYALAANIGGYLYNKGSVLIYQHNPATGIYECWGPINVS